MASGDRLRAALGAPPADPPGPVTLPTTSPVQLWQSLEDRLLFRQAQELLGGLTGVTSDRAGSVFAAAARALGLDVVGVARRFTRNLEHGHDDPDGPLVVRLAEMALSAGPVSESPAGPALPWAAAGGSGEGEWTGRPESPLTLDVGAVPPDGPTVLSVGGELDLATAGELRATVRALCRADQDAVPTRGEFLLRLEAVTSLDCSGVAALVGVHADVSARGMTLRVVPPADPGARSMLLLVTAMGWLPAAFVPGC